MVFTQMACILLLCLEKPLEVLGNVLLTVIILEAVQMVCGIKGILFDFGKTSGGGSTFFLNVFLCLCISKSKYHLSAIWRLWLGQILLSNLFGTLWLGGNGRIFYDKSQNVNIL